MKVVAVVQARMGSSRFPGKVLRRVQGQVLIDLLLARLQRAHTVTETVLATTDRAIDDELSRHVASLGYRVIRGSENDVLARYTLAASDTSADVIVRITGDCPLVMPELVDAVVGRLLETGADYVSNTAPPTFPDGLDVEAFSLRSLELAAVEASDDFDREHVTPFLRRDARVSRRSFAAGHDRSATRLTVDEPRDLAAIEAVLEAFSPDIYFGLDDLNSLLDERPDFFAGDSTIKRNEGATMGSGQKLWKRAKQIIPGGNMLLSKRAEMFLPDGWPAYFDRTDGCRVWDLDGNEFLDMGLMGVGTNTLGYSNPEVDEAVRDVVAKGNLSTLNCPEEVWLAERLIELNPFADMVRFARTGGEANAVAIRIARAASGRDGVAVCGYHGWHDWYLSANLGDSQNLSQHLLPGLSPSGVPKSLADSTFPFLYNDFDRLVELVATRDIGVIKMEVYRNVEPEDGFLAKVRQLATEHNIVLIFDECSSGFRETYGGLHQKYAVEPDVAVYGKTLGNGYAITAIVGRREVMEAAQGTFISSTFWTERIGPAAALKTLEVMNKVRSWELITETGSKYNQTLREVADRSELEISIAGLPAMGSYTVTGPDSAAAKTFISQELLKRGILAGTAFYASTAHEQSHLDRFFEALDPIFGQIAQARTEKSGLEGLLDGPVCHTGFKRLN